MARRLWAARATRASPAARSTRRARSPRTSCGARSSRSSATKRGRDSAPARARPGDGQRRISRGRMPLSRARCRREPDSRRRWHPATSRPRIAPRSARDRAALPVRRRSQPDGRAARPSVALAGHARVRQAADLSRPSPRAGDSLVGATWATSATATGTAARRRRTEALPLFDDADLAPASEMRSGHGFELACEPDDSAAIVAARSRRWPRSMRRLAARPLVGGARSLVRRLVLGRGPSPGRQLFRELSDRLLAWPATLPERASDRLLEQSASLAARYASSTGRWRSPRSSPTNTATSSRELGSTPSSATRRGTWCAATAATRALEPGAGSRRGGSSASSAKPASTESRAGRTSTATSCSSSGRCSSRDRGGRIGLVLPSGIVSDSGAAPLRRHLFDHADVDSITGLDNRHGIFPIHRSLRFVLLTGHGRPADERSRAVSGSGTRTTSKAQAPLPSCRHRAGRSWRGCRATMILRIPEMATERDLKLLERISARFPWLGSGDGWNVRFGRELNATDDSGAFAPFTGADGARPVLEGKQIEPFRVSIDRSRYELRPGATREEGPAPRSPRLSRRRQRDKPPHADRRGDSAACRHDAHALLPENAAAADAQHVLCALLNSFVANYLIRSASTRT